jgi:hypothetical protein
MLPLEKEVALTTCVRAQRRRENTLALRGTTEGVTGSIRCPANSALNHPCMGAITTRPGRVRFCRALLGAMPNVAVTASGDQEGDCR